VALCQKPFKESICTSFNAITGTAIGGDTFSGDLFWSPAEVHQQHPSPFNENDLAKKHLHYYRYEDGLESKEWWSLGPYL
jgi:hypothetical protein